MLTLGPPLRGERLNEALALDTIWPEEVGPSYSPGWNLATDGFSPVNVSLGASRNSISILAVCTRVSQRSEVRWKEKWKQSSHASWLLKVPTRMGRWSSA